MSKLLNIDLQTKVGVLLEVYPQLEDTLLTLSPSFAKLKNPIIRKTIGRVATLGQVAEVGNIDAAYLITELRKAISDNSVVDNELPIELDTIEKPQWLDKENVEFTFDACSIIESGGSPMKAIIDNANKLNHEEIMLLITPFRPTPIIELLQNKGFAIWGEMINNQSYTYIKKSILD